MLLSVSFTRAASVLIWLAERFATVLLPRILSKTRVSLVIVKLFDTISAVLFILPAVLLALNLKNHVPWSPDEKLYVIFITDVSFVLL